MVTPPPSWPTPPDIPGTTGEREMLEAFLDYQRAAMVKKASGLAEEAARRRLVPSMTTLAGLVKHLTGVERNWFERYLAQRQDAEIDGIVGGGPASWELAEAETLPALLAEYERACAQSRRTAAGVPLDVTRPHPRLGEVSLRWIYLHMIEETARHLGHADILREQIDGATGD